MKAKTILFCLLCMSVLSVHAQIFTAQAGLNLSNFKIKNDGYVEGSGSRPGFHAGGACEFALNNWLLLEPGVMYNSKGGKQGGEGVGQAINMHYIDVPLNIKASKNMEGGKMRVYVKAGPYIGIGLAGRVKSKDMSEHQGVQETESSNDKINWGSGNNDDLKRIESGVTFGAGIEYKMLQFGLSYDMGLSGITASIDNHYSINNRVLRFSVGYRFSKNRKSLM